MTIDPTIVIAAIATLSAALGTAARMIYVDLRRDRDFWRDTALKALGHTDRAIELAAKAAPDA
jgi:hypothetical protein